MSRRRSSRMNSALDASFQIPLAVNTTANNLLLEDDALEHDFFDGFDYTITTPVLTRPSSSNLLTSDLESLQEVLDPLRSGQKNFHPSYDYAQEEREVEMDDTTADETTPRATRVPNPVRLGLLPTPRANKNKLGLMDSDEASRLPTSISSPRVVNEYFLKRRKGGDICSSPTYEVPRSSMSPSATPKPKPRRVRISRAPPSVHSTPVSATLPSSVSRSDNAQLRVEHHEVEANMIHHEHALSSCNHSAVTSEAELTAGLREDYATPASLRRSGRDPHSPGETLSKPSSSSRPKRLTSSQRRYSRSRTRSTSPSPLSRVAHDAVMLPIQEEDEDLQDRDDQLSIAKPQHSSGFSVPVMTETDDLRQRKTEKRLQPSSASTESAAYNNARPKADSSRKDTARRIGDNLASQPAPKRRKTDVDIVHPDSRAVEAGKSQAAPDQHGLADPTPIHIVPTKASTKDYAVTQEDTSSPTGKPVAPESNIRTSSLPPVSYPLIEPRSELPSGAVNIDHAQPELNEEPDEVQDFLTRYAKKYGSGADGTSDIFSVTPEKPLTVISRQNSSQLQIGVPPKRGNTTPKTRAPSGKHAQVKAKRAASHDDPKGKLPLRDTAPRLPLRQTADGTGTLKSRSIPTEENCGGSIVEKIASQIEDSVDELVVESQAPGLITVEVGSQEPTQPLASPGRKDVFTTAKQLMDDVPSRQTSEASSNALAGPAESVVHALSTLSSEPEISQSTTGLAVTVRKPKIEQTGHRNQRSEDGKPPKKPPSLSALQAPKRQISSEPRTDDMFARKKRDNYLQKGLDLTAHSSRRYAQNPAPESDSRDKFCQDPSSQRYQGSSKPPANATEHLGPASATVAESSESVKVVLDLTSDAGDQKNVQRATSDLECRDRSKNKSRRVLQRKGNISNIREKQSVIPDSRRQDDTVLTVEDSCSDHAHTRQGDQTKPNVEDDSNTSTGSISAITGRLANFGQRIMGSFGLLSNHSETAVAAPPPERARESHVPAFEHGHQVSRRNRGSDLQQETSTMPAGTLSPRKVGQIEVDGHDHVPICNDDIDRCQSECRDHAGQTKVNKSVAYDRVVYPASPKTNDDERNTLEVGDDTSRISDMSRKRPFRAISSGMAQGDNDNSELSADDRTRKRTKLLGDGVTLAAGPVGASKPSQSDKSRSMITKLAVSTRGLLAKKRTKTAITRSATRNAGSNSSCKLSNGAGKGGPISSTLTVPVGPTFTTDLLRQQRVLAKSERELEQREKYHERKAKVFKSDDMDTANRAKARALVSKTQTRGPWQPTVPHASRFETGTRQASRKEEFEDKLKTWEQRASAGPSVTGQSASNKKLPDFKSLHAAQEASLATKAVRRRELIAPTVPISPHFVVDDRLAERQKFEEARRAKEAEAQRVMEERRRAREEEEERQWREARKRTVPRANTVPEWYAHAPKRTTQSR